MKQIVYDMKLNSWISFEQIPKDQPQKNLINFYKTNEIPSGYSGRIYDYHYEIYDFIGNEQRNVIRIKITDWCISKWKFNIEDLEYVLLECAKEEVVKRFELGILQEVSTIELKYDTIPPNCSCEAIRINLQM